MSLRKHVRASILRDGDLRPHPTGVYVTDVPVDPVTGLCSLPYDVAETFGYTKIDAINNTICRLVNNREELLEAAYDEPDWSLLEDPAVVATLPHIGGHWGLVRRLKPRSVDDLAEILALIRPGKRHLVGMPVEKRRRELWRSTGDGYRFKKSHAYAYALTIVAALNLYRREERR